MQKDTKNLVFAGIAALLVIGAGIAIYFSGALDTRASAGKITITPSENVNLGDIDIFGGKKETNFTIKNDGSDSVDITSAQTSCMCTEAFYDNKVITMHEPIYIGVLKSGESKNVRVVFNPLAHGPDAVGPIDREIIFKTDSSVSPVAKFRFSGNVIKKPGATMPANGDTMKNM